MSNLTLKAMKLHPNEIYFYYDASNSKSKKARAYAYSVANHVNEFPFHTARLTTTQWRQILDRLKLRPKDLLNRAHPDYQRLIAGRTFEDEGWLNILIRHSYLIKGAIAVKGNRAVLCDRPEDIFRLSSEKIALSRIE